MTELLRMWKSGKEYIIGRKRMIGRAYEKIIQIIYLTGFRDFSWM